MLQRFVSFMVITEQHFYPVTLYRSEPKFMEERLITAVSSSIQADIGD